MPINVRIYSVNPARSKKILRELNYISHKSFLTTIPLKEFEVDVANFLKDNSPRSGDSWYKDYLTYLGVRRVKSRDSFMSFADSWRVARKTNGNAVSLNIWNLLETTGGQANKIKFASVEYGTRTSDWIAKRTFRFQLKGEWITISQGQSVLHKGTKGAEVLKKTSEYIRTELMPKINEKVQTIIARRLA